MTLFAPLLLFLVFNTVIYFYAVFLSQAKWQWQSKAVKTNIGLRKSKFPIIIYVLKYSNITILKALKDTNMEENAD